MPEPGERPRGPALRVIRGDATAEEIAALVAVLLSRPVPAGRRPRRAPSPWADRSRLLRRPLHRGPGAWRSSGLPGG